MHDLDESARGTLRVSAPVSFASRHLAPLLDEFQKIHPAVTIDLELNDRKVDIVDEGFDVALRIGHLKSSSLIARRLAPVRIVHCAAPAYLERCGTPSSLDELKDHRLLHYRYLEGAAGTGSAGDSSRGGLVSNNGDFLTSAAIAGAGIITQPTFITGEAIASGQLRCILHDYEPEPMNLYAVYAHRKLLPSKVRLFIDFASGYFGDPPYWDEILAEDA